MTKLNIENMRHIKEIRDLKKVRTDPFISRGGQIFQSTLCGYSKLVSWDACHNAKDKKLIRSSCDEKTSKNCWNNTKFDFTQFSTVFGRFLSCHLSYLILKTWKSLNSINGVRVVKIMYLPFIRLWIINLPTRFLWRNW